MNLKSSLVVFFFGICLFAAIAAGSEENEISIGNYAPEVNKISIDNNGKEAFEGSLCFWDPKHFPTNNPPTIEWPLKISAGESYYIELLNYFVARLKPRCG